MEIENLNIPMIQNCNDRELIQITSFDIVGAKDNVKFLINELAKRLETANNQIDLYESRFLKQTT